jgi:hypothetical protein
MECFIAVVICLCVYVIFCYDLIYMCVVEFKIEGSAVETRVMSI